MNKIISKKIGEKTKLFSFCLFFTKILKKIFFVLKIKILNKKKLKCKNKFQEQNKTK
jgi:hypothetical protein